MARPTKLTPDLVERAKTYLATCVDTPMMTEKGAISYVDVNLPTVVGLALFLNINKDTVYDWCKLTDELAQEFSDIVSEVTNSQEKRLINNGMGGLYVPKIVGMVLSKHGYSEKTETDITSKGEKISSSEDISKALEIAKRYEEELKKEL